MMIDMKENLYMGNLEGMENNFIVMKICMTGNGVMIKKMELENICWIMVLKLKVNGKKIFQWKKKINLLYISLFYYYITFICSFSIKNIFFFEIDYLI